MVCLRDLPFVHHLELVGLKALLRKNRNYDCSASSSFHCCYGSECLFCSLVCHDFCFYSTSSKA